MKAGGNSKIDCSSSSSSILGLGCFADYRRGYTNKVRCGSSLARCCRLAVAPMYLMQSAIAEALPIYGVTGLNFEGVVPAYTLDLYNFE